MHDCDLRRHHHSDEDEEVLSLELKNLKITSVLGRGAKGIVFRVQTKDAQVLALKAILRSSIERKKNKKKKPDANSNGDEYRRVCFEREVLSSFNHPLFPKLHGVLETDLIIGYAIDYCPGRDLNVLRKIQTEKMFSADIIRFYAAELVLALEYLHGLGIVYRDLKPENVLIQDNGHLMLVDFDLSTKLSTAKSPVSRPSPLPSNTQIQQKKKNSNKFALCFSRRDTSVSPEYSMSPPSISSPESESSDCSSVEKSNSFVGTEEYVAPEIVLGHGHDFAVDLWCLGVMLYEMLYGTTPFRGPTRKDTFYRIITKSPDLTGERTALRDLIRKLLNKDPRRRITIREMKGHDFFKAVDWDTLLEMPRPPFIPPLTDVEGIEEIDVESYVQEIFKADDIELEKDYNKNIFENSPKNAEYENDHFLIF